MDKIKITVLNGSPGGELSSTFHHVLYMEKHFSQHEFKSIHIAKTINKIEKNPALLDEIIEDINKAQLIIWCFPVYYALVPGQLKRFIELIFEKEKASAFANKYCTTISGSAHYFDHTAHYYVNAVSEDLKMHYIEGISFDSSDIYDKEKRKTLIKFTNFLLDGIQNKVLTDTKFPKLNMDVKKYRPDPVSDIPKTNGKKVVIIQDDESKDTNLSHMVKVFRQSLSLESIVIKLSDIKTSGGCLGCIRCAPIGEECIYKDEMTAFITDQISITDVTIYAGEIKDRYLSSHYKIFLDRHFSEGHRPLSKKTYMGFILSGSVREIPFLQDALRGPLETGGVNYLGIVNDDYEDLKDVTSLLQNFAATLTWTLNNDFDKPRTFLGEGGHRVFRDIVYNNSPVLEMDHYYYKKYKVYDYPYLNLKQRFMNFMLKLQMITKKSKKSFFVNLRKQQALRIKDSFKDDFK